MSYRHARGVYSLRSGGRGRVTAPKSNATYLAIDRAIADARAGRGGVAHSRDAHYAGVKTRSWRRVPLRARSAPPRRSSAVGLPDDLEGTSVLRADGEWT